MDETKALLHGKHQKGDAFDDLEEESIGWVDAVSEFLKKNIFECVYMMLSQQHADKPKFARFWTIASILLESLQILYHPFHQSLFNWYGVSQLSDALETFAQFSSDARTSWYISIVLVLSLHVMGIAMAALKKKDIKWEWLITLTTWHCSCSVSVFYIPILNSLFHVIFGCSPGESFDAYDTVCWEGVHFAMGLFSIIFATVFIASLVMLHLCFFEQLPTTTKYRYDARAHGRVDLARFILITVMLLAFNALDDARWFLVTVLVVIAFSLVYSQLTYMPYYVMYVQYLYLTQALVFAWAVQCLIISEALYEDGTISQGPAAMFYFCIFVMLALAVFLCEWRRSNVISQPIHLLSPYLVEYKARVFLTEKTEEEVRKDDELQDEEAKRQRLEMVYSEAEEMYSTAVARYPNSAHLHLLFTVFYLAYPKKRPLAYREISITSECTPPVDIQFAIFRHRNNADLDENATRSATVLEYIEFNQRKAKGLKAASEAAQLLLKFWKELMKTTPRIETLIKLGAKSRRCIQLGLSHYRRALSINPTSIEVLRSFGSFIENFMGDSNMSMSLYDAADTLEDSSAAANRQLGERLDFLSKQETNLDIFDDKNGVIGVTLEKGRTGHIFSVNESALTMFGYNSLKDLIDINISALMPWPISEAHDSFLIDFLNHDNTSSSILNSTRMVIGKHKAGYVFPVNLYIRWSDASAGKMIGVLCPIVTEDEFAVIRSDGYLQNSSSGASEWFSFSQDQIADRMVHIQDLLPAVELEERKDVWAEGSFLDQAVERSVSGVATTARRFMSGNKDQFAVNIYVKRYPVSNNFLNIIRFHKEGYMEQLGLSPDLEELANATAYPNVNPFRGGRRRGSNVGVSNPASTTSVERGKLGVPRLGSELKAPVESKAVIAEAAPSVTSSEGARSRLTADSRNTRNRMAMFGMDNKSGMTESVSTAAVKTNQIHKQLIQIIQRSNKITSQGLNNMNRLHFLLLIILLALVVTVFTLTELDLEEEHDRANFIRDSGYRGMQTQSIALLAQRLLWINQTLDSTYTYDEVKTEMATRIRALQDLDYKIINDESTKDNSHLLLYINSFFTIYKYVAGVVKTEHVNLIEGSFKFVAHATSILDLPLNKYYKLQSDFYFVIQNGDSILPKAYAESSAAYRNSNVRDLESKVELDLIIMFCLIALFILFFVFVARPGIMAVEQAKMKVLGIFLAISPRVVASLYSRFSRLSDTSNQRSDELDHTAVVPGSNAIDDGPRKLTDPKQKYAAESGTDVKEDHKKTRVAETSHKHRFILAVKYLAFVIVVTAYFIFLWAITVEAKNATQGSNAEAQFSSDRLIYLKSGILHTNEYLATGNNFQDAHDAWTNAFDIEHKVLFGDNSYDLPGSDSPGSGANQELMFGNACNELQDRLSNTDYSNCFTWNNALMTYGLHYALSYATDLGEGLLTTANAGILVSNTTSTATLDQIRTDLEYLDVLINTYLDPGIDLSSYLYSQESVNAYNLAISENVSGFVVFFLAVLCFEIFIFHGVVRELNLALRATRALVIIIPPKIVRELDVVSEMIAEAAARQKEDDDDDDDEFLDLGNDEERDIDEEKVNGMDEGTNAANRPKLLSDAGDDDPPASPPLPPTLPPSSEGYSGPTFHANKRNAHDVPSIELSTVVKSNKGKRPFQAFHESGVGLGSSLAL